MFSNLRMILLAGLLVVATGQVKQQDDRMYDGLKGRVKTVSRQVADVDAKERIEKARVEVEKTAYDEAGNQTLAETYDTKGNLTSTMVYSFIGRQRVATRTHSPASTNLVRVEPLPRGQRIDPRYTYRFTHQYDAQGRRIQTRVYLSNGELWIRHVFKFERDSKTHLTYDRGTLNQKLVYTLDEQGNEIRLIDHSEYVVADKTIYKYDEFDAQGNWTRRRVYKGVKEVEDSRFTLAPPWSVEYRVITYY